MANTGEHECPTCDYSSDSKGGVAIHHHHAHGESIAKSEYECNVCGTAVERYDCEVTGDVVWCSDKCEAEYKRNQSPEDHPRWKGGDVAVECAVCGDEKEVGRHRIARSERFFFDDDCYGEWKSDAMTGDGNPNYNSVEVECEWCGNTVEKIPAKLDRDEHNFCSHDCHNEWMAEYQHGPNHHQWTGGRRDYGPGWNERKRESVRERDGRACFDCGIAESKSIAEYGRKLDVHHLVPPSSDTNPAVHNAKRNLVTLCIPCHYSWDRIGNQPPAATVSMEVSNV